MVVSGRVENGVVVLQGGCALPEGADVTVSYSGSSGTKPAAPKNRIQVPLVRTGRPGTLDLTNEQIARILDEEDAAPRR